MYIWMYTFWYVYSQTYMSVCAKVYFLLTVHIFGVTKQILLPHCTYDPHSHFAAWAYRPNIFGYMCQNTTNCNIYFTCFTMCGPATNMPLNMPHIQISPCEDMWLLFQYMYIIWTHCSQHCEQKNWYTYISHYLHVPMKEYACHCMSTVLYI